MIPKVVYNHIDETSTVRTERLKVPYTKYAYNPKSTIRELLGQDVIIRNMVVNNIITDDECYIVDVEYVNIKFNPFEIIFIDIKDLKLTIPNSTVYATKINGCNVCIKIPNIQLFKTKIPVTINSKLNNNNTADGQLADHFAYFGKIVRKPMNSLCTPLKYPNHQATPFKIAPIKKLYNDGYKLKQTYSIDQIKDAYRAELSQFQQFNAVDNIVVAKSFSECKYGTTAYLIDFKLLPADRYINGIILIQPKRNPYTILYYPTNTYTLYIEELESIASFLEMDEINALNYDCVMN